MRKEITTAARLEDLISGAEELAICIENQAQALFENAFELRLCGLLCGSSSDYDRKSAALDWMVQNYDSASSCVYNALVLSQHIQLLLELADRAVRGEE
jgi:hypothetical protein